MRVIYTVLAFVLAFGGMTLVAPAAHATHPRVSGVAVCNTDTGKVDVTWTVTGDPSYPKVGAVIKKTTPDGLGLVGKSVKGTSSQTAVQTGLNRGTHNLHVWVQFENHKPGDLVKQSGSVKFKGECERTKPDKPSKDNKVVVTVGEPNCETATVEVTTTTTVYTYAFDEAKWEWVETATVTVTKATREATLEECPPVVPEKPKPVVTETSSQTIDCETRKVTITTVKVTTDWVLVDNVWVQAEPVRTEVVTYRDVTAQECPTPTTPPTTEPPATTQPPVTAPPATTQEPRTANRTGELAYTGSQTWYLVGAAVILLGLGAFLLLAPRRKRLLARKHL